MPTSCSNRAASKQSSQFVRRAVWRAVRGSPGACHRRLVDVKRLSNKAGPHCCDPDWPNKARALIKRAPKDNDRALSMFVFGWRSLRLTNTTIKQMNTNLDSRPVYSRSINAAPLILSFTLRVLNRPGFRTPEPDTIENYPFLFDAHSSPIKCLWARISRFLSVDSSFGISNALLHCRDGRLSAFFSNCFADALCCDGE
jgi:hypothetical protein